METTSERSPSKMRKPEFRGVVQNEIIRRILQEFSTKKFKTDEIMQRAYDTETNEEFKKVRNTLGSALSRGLTKGYWKGGSGEYYLED